jgi:tetratricopeptide (TPR) repeat protein
VYKRRMRRAWVSLLTAVVVSLATPAFAAPKDNREMKARELFAGQHYQEALDLYIKLYAEKLHPNYLRNIGRCYQNLGDPEKAIGSFREYLRKARSLPAEERAEIEGYIKEMEDLKKQRETPPPPPPPPHHEESRPPDYTPPPPPQHLVITPPPPKHDEETGPVYTRWWFWTAAAVVVAGATVGALAASGTFKAKEPSCGAGRICQ